MICMIEPWRDGRAVLDVWMSHGDQVEVLPGRFQP